METNQHFILKDLCFFLFEYLLLLIDKPKAFLI